MEDAETALSCMHRIAKERPESWSRHLEAKVSGRQQPLALVLDRTPKELHDMRQRFLQHANAGEYFDGFEAIPADTDNELFNRILTRMFVKSDSEDIDALQKACLETRIEVGEVVCIVHADPDIEKDGDIEDGLIVWVVVKP